MEDEQLEQLLELLDRDYDAAQAALDRGSELVDRTRTIGLTLLAAILAVAVQQTNAPIALLALGLVIVLALNDGYQSANLEETLTHARRLERVSQAHFSTTLHPDDAEEREALIDRIGGLKLGVSVRQLYEFRLSELRFVRPRVVFGILYPFLAFVAAAAASLSVGNSTTAEKVVVLGLSALGVAAAYWLLRTRPRFGLSGVSSKPAAIRFWTAARSPLTAVVGAAIVAVSAYALLSRLAPPPAPSSKAPAVSLLAPPGSTLMALDVVARPASCGGETKISIDGRLRLAARQPDRRVSLVVLDHAGDVPRGWSVQGDEYVSVLTRRQGVTAASLELSARWTGQERNGRCVLRLPSLAVAGAGPDSASGSTRVEPARPLRAGSGQRLLRACELPAAGSACRGDVVLRDSSRAVSSRAFAIAGLGLGAVLVLLAALARWPDAANLLPGQPRRR